MKYSIITEDWIPVLYKNGETREISLRKVFEDAHLIETVADELEMNNLGFIRLLCVFYMDAYRPEIEEDRIDELKKKSFDMETFDSYVTMCEKSGNCFDLFDEKVPFLQTGHMEGKKKSYNPVSRISDFECNGLETTFFHGNNEKNYSFTPAECARKLCQKMTTVIKAKQGEGFLGFFPLQNAIFMINRGRTLRETIILNSLSKAEWLSSGTFFDYGTEENRKGPSWRQGEKTDIKKERVYPETSLLSMMTFMPVNIKLIVEDNGLVKEALYTPKKFKDGSNDNAFESSNPIYKYYDPMVMLEIAVKSEKTGEDKTAIVPVKLDPSVGLWEMIDCLYTKTGRNIIRPRVLPAKTNSIIMIETWSPCKNGNGKGIIYHDRFEINTEILGGISLEEIINSSENYEMIIQGFNARKVKSAFNAMSKELGEKKYIKEIQSEFRQYMNINYFPVFIKKINEFGEDNPIEAAMYIKEFRNNTLEAFMTIALDYLDKLPNTFHYLKTKEKCKQEIRKYFCSLKYL